MSKKSKKVALTDFMGATPISDIPTSSIPTSSDYGGGYGGRSSGPNWAAGGGDEDPWRNKDRMDRPRDNDTGFSRDGFGSDRASGGFDRPSRGGDRYGDRPPRNDEDSFSRDNFGSDRSARPERAERSDRGFGSDRPPRSDRGFGDDDTFSRDNFGSDRSARPERAERSDRGFGSDRPPRSDRGFGGDRAPRNDEDSFSRDNFGSDRSARPERTERSDRPRGDRPPRAPRDDFSRDTFGSADSNKDHKRAAAPKPAAVEKPTTYVDADGFTQVTRKAATIQDKKRDVRKTNEKEVYVNSRFDIGDDDEDVDQQVAQVIAQVAKVTVDEPKAAPVVAKPVPVKAAPKRVPANALEAAIDGDVVVVTLGLIKKNLAAELPLTAAQSTNLATAIAHSAAKGEYEIFNVLSLLNKTIGDANGRKAKAAGDDVAAAKEAGQDESRAIMLQVLTITAAKSGADAVMEIVTDSEGAIDYLPAAIAAMPRGSARDAARDAAFIKAGLKFLAADQDSEETMSTPAIKVAKALPAGKAVAVAKEVSGQFAKKADMITQVVEALYANDSADKAQFKTLFEQLVEGGVVTFDNIVEWKTDVENKSNAKMAALVGTTVWMMSNAPAQEEEEIDEDAEEDNYGLEDY